MRRLRPASSPIADLSVRDGGIDAHRQPRLHVEWTTGPMPWAWIQSEKTPFILKIVQHLLRKKNLLNQAHVNRCFHMQPEYL